MLAVTLLLSVFLLAPEGCGCVPGWQQSQCSELLVQPLSPAAPPVPSLSPAEPGAHEYHILESLWLSLGSGKANGVSPDWPLAWPPLASPCLPVPADHGIIRSSPRSSVSEGAEH